MEGRQGMQAKPAQLRGRAAERPDLAPPRQGAEAAIFVALRLQPTRVILRSGAAPYHEKWKFLLLRTCSAAFCATTITPSRRSFTVPQHPRVEASHLTSAEAGSG